MSIKFNRSIFSKGLFYCNPNLRFSCGPGEQKSLMGLIFLELTDFREHGEGSNSRSIVIATPFSCFSKLYDQLDGEGYINKVMVRTMSCCKNWISCVVGDTFSKPGPPA